MVSIYDKKIMYILFVAIVAGLYKLFIDSIITTPDRTVASVAITIDLLIFVPFTYYWLNRSTIKSWTEVTAVFIASLAIAKIFLPEPEQNILKIIHFMAVPVEGFLLYSLFKRIKTTITHFRIQSQKHDIFDALQMTISTLPFQKRLQDILISEMAFLYYLFSRKEIDEGFSTYKQSGISAIFGAIFMALLIELIAVHMVLQRVIPVGVWFFGALSIYGILYLLSIYRSIKNRPITFDNQKIYLNTGMIWRTIVSVKEIEAIIVSRKEVKEPHVKLNFIVGHNLILKFRENICVDGLYGIKKMTRIVTLYIDDKSGFLEAINELLTNGLDDVAEKTLK